MIDRNSAPHRDDLVVLVHGLAAHRLMMHLLAQSLDDLGVVPREVGCFAGIFAQIVKFHCIV